MKVFFEIVFRKWWKVPGQRNLNPDTPDLIGGGLGVYPRTQFMNCGNLIAH